MLVGFELVLAAIVVLCAIAVVVISQISHKKRPLTYGVLLAFAIISAILGAIPQIGPICSALGGVCPNLTAEPSKPVPPTEPVRIVERERVIERVIVRENDGASEQKSAVAAYAKRTAGAAGETARSGEPGDTSAAAASSAATTVATAAAFRVPQPAGPASGNARRAPSEIQPEARAPKAPEAPKQPAVSALQRDIIAELKRLKCLSSKAPVEWGEDVHQALNRFNVYAMHRLPSEPSAKSLDVLRSRTDPPCSLG